MRLWIDDEFGAAVTLMFGFAGSAVDNGIHSTARFSADVFDAESGEDVFGGISTTFTEGHIVFFGTTFVAVADDLDAIDAFSGFEALSVIFDDALGIATDGGFVEIEVSGAHLAERSIDTMFVFTNFVFGAICVGEAFGSGHAAVIFAHVIGGAILFDGFRIAFGTTAAIAAFLTGGAIDADFGITITVDALACTAIADIAFVFFA